MLTRAQEAFLQEVWVKQHYRRRGVCFAGQGTLGDNIGRCERQVRRYIQQLAPQWLSVKRQGRGKPLLLWAKPPQSGDCQPRTSMSAPTGHPCPPRAGHPCPPSIKELNTLGGHRGSRGGAEAPPAATAGPLFERKKINLFQQSLRLKTSGNLALTAVRCFEAGMFRFVTWGERTRTVIGVADEGGRLLLTLIVDGSEEAETVNVPRPMVGGLNLWNE